jgi:hypothetical protein
MKERPLNVTIDRIIIGDILELGRKWDINNAGLYDARCGAINIWCSPEDQPTCWLGEILKGGLKYPRDYVGAIRWDDSYNLFLEATPYKLVDVMANRIWEEELEKVDVTLEDISEDQWDSIFGWLEEKALFLLKRASNSLQIDMPEV